MHQYKIVVGSLSQELDPEYPSTLPTASFPGA